MESTLLELFLDNFKVKLNIWGITFLSSRQKNTQTLADLEITISDVKAILANLSIEDYSEGPLPESFYGNSEMWVFGNCKGMRDLYQNHFRIPKQPNHLYFISLC